MCVCVCVCMCVCVCLCMYVRVRIELLSDWSEWLYFHTTFSCLESVSYILSVPHILSTFLSLFPSLLSVCLSTFLLSVCLSFYSAYLPSLSACTPATFCPACLPAFLPSCLTAFLSSFLPACLPSFLPSCLPACLPSCLPAFLPFCLSLVCLSAYHLIPLLSTPFMSF